jgi:hypothetical protein
MKNWLFLDSRVEEILDHLRIVQILHLWLLERLDGQHLVLAQVFFTRQEEIYWHISYVLWKGPHLVYMLINIDDQVIAVLIEPLKSLVLVEKLVDFCI